MPAPADQFLQLSTQDGEIGDLAFDFTQVLARDFIVARGWSEERALNLAQAILRDNIERIFPQRLG